MEKQKIVFIVGSGRSGTTLLRNILDIHPDIGVSPELRFFDLALSNKSKIKDLAEIKNREIIIKGLLINLVNQMILYGKRLIVTPRL